LIKDRTLGNIILDLDINCCARKLLWIFLTNKTSPSAAIISFNI
jgi:hypothetical protein